MLTKTMCSVTVEIVKFKKLVEIDSTVCCRGVRVFWYWGETETSLAAHRFSKPQAAVHCLRCSSLGVALLKHYFFFLSHKFSTLFFFFFCTWHVCGVIFCSRNFPIPIFRSKFSAPFHPFWFILLNFIWYNNFRYNNYYYI